MATAGKIILTDSGKRGLLPSGKTAIADADGNCAACCGCGNLDNLPWYICCNNTNGTMPVLLRRQYPTTPTYDYAGSSTYRCIHLGQYQNSKSVYLKCLENGLYRVTVDDETPIEGNLTEVVHGSMGQIGDYVFTGVGPNPLTSRDYLSPRDMSQCERRCSIFQYVQKPSHHFSNMPETVTVTFSGVSNFPDRIEPGYRDWRDEYACTDIGEGNCITDLEWRQASSYLYPLLTPEGWANGKSFVLTKRYPGYDGDCDYIYNSDEHETQEILSGCSVNTPRNLSYWYQVWLRPEENPPEIRMTLHLSSPPSIGCSGSWSYSTRGGWCPHESCEGGAIFKMVDSTQQDDCWGYVFHNMATEVEDWMHVPTGGLGGTATLSYTTVDEYEYEEW